MAHPLEADPLLPPLSYYRQRGALREGGERLPFETYYKELPGPRAT